MIVKLAKPIDVLGKPVEQLEFDEDTVNGAAVMAAYKYADSCGDEPGCPSYNLSAALMVVSKACAVSVPALEKLHHKDFNLLISMAGPLLEVSD